MILLTPHTHNAGYYLKDDPNGRKKEADIQTCTHCQAVINMQVWKDDGAFCKLCNAPICNHCGDRALTFGCEPFMKKLEVFTDAVVKYQQYLKMAGLDPVNPPSLIITGL